MPLYILVIKTHPKQHKGKTKLWGTISIKGGKVLREVSHASTLTELSRELRKSNLIPTDIEIKKKCSIEFQYQSKNPL